MIKVKVPELLDKKGKNPTDLMRHANIAYATAHKLARIVYFMLKRREPYQDPGADYYDQQYQARVIRHLTHRVAKLGFRLQPIGPDQVS